MCPFPEQGQVTDTTGQAVFLVRLRPDGRFDTGIWNAPPAQDRLVISVTWHEPMLVAAVDPEAEDRLVGLRGATQGTFLSDAPARTTDTGGGAPSKKIVPVLATSRRYADTTASVALSRARLDAALPACLDAVLAAMAAAPATHLRNDLLDTEAAYQHTTADEIARSGEGLGFVYGHEWLLQIGGVTYLQAPDGSLAAVPVPTTRPPTSCRTRSASPHVADRRHVLPHGAKRVGARAGRPDEDRVRRRRHVRPFRLTTFNPLSRVPMET